MTHAFPLLLIAFLASGSAITLAAELTRFLREREENGDDESAGGPAS